MISKVDIDRIFKTPSEFKKERLTDILTELADFVAQTEKERDEAVKKYQEFNKDEEIQKLKDKLKTREEFTKNRRVFEVTPEEVEKIEAWKEAHINEAHGGNAYAGAIGGRFTYEFTPTGIGTFGSIKCTCGAEFTFADDF